ncbi:MAG TPA: ATP-binding protein [Actinospica sp.]|nr:ATP-binding protein [Actinospica sp.]
MSGTSLDEQGLGSAGGRDDAAGRGREPLARRLPRRLAVLSFAADRDHLALARMTAMHVAGLAGLPIGRVTDIRLAVDEACSLFLGEAERTPGALLTVRFEQVAEFLRIAVSGPAPARDPDAEDIGWLMLCALTVRPRWEVRGGTGTLTMNEPLSPGAGAGR